MDATRLRRTKDEARRKWYGSLRAVRFARHMGGQVTDTVRLAAQRLGHRRA
jgi:hypothetical protein